MTRKQPDHLQTKCHSVSRPDFHRIITKCISQWFSSTPKPSVTLQNTQNELFQWFELETGSNLFHACFYKWNNWFERKVAFSLFRMHSFVIYRRERITTIPYKSPVPVEVIATHLYSREKWKESRNASVFIRIEFENVFCRTRLKSDACKRFPGSSWC